MRTWIYKNLIYRKPLYNWGFFVRKNLAFKPGDPAIEILETIESEGIDLVIMGTHGRKGLEHAIFGSVAEHVVQESPVPMLIIKPHKLK